VVGREAAEEAEAATVEGRAAAEALSAEVAGGAATRRPRWAERAMEGTRRAAAASA